MDLITYALCKKQGGGSITYTLTADTENKTIVLTPSEGTAQVITVPYATDASTVNGHEVPELENGKIPANYLPSFVDNVDEYDNISLFPVVGESNRIYIDKSTNKTYRWSGTAYVEISESIALGETSSTAYRGDRGKIAYDHSQSAHAPSNAEANQNAFSNVKIDSDIINASAKTDTLEFIAGDNIILTPNVSNKKITVSQVPVRKTVSGDIASFSDGTGDPFLEVKASIEPQQDLHGYENPWVGGAGKNKCNTHGYDGIGYNTTTGTTVFLTDSSTAVTVNKNVISYSLVVSWSGVAFRTPSLASGDYHVHAELNADANRVSVYRINSSNVIQTVSNLSNERTVDLNRTCDSGDYIVIWVGSHNAANVSITNLQIESGQAFTSFAPYSNICPISGHTEADVTVTDDLTTPTETHTLSISFHDNSDNPITVYGGRLNVTSGELRVTHANIASYNGETINEPWISSMDVYSAGATPTTGAQVVYPLATPQTYQLTPAQVTTLLNQNNIFADCGQIEVAYKTPFYTDLTTKNEVQVLINESITSALNASY